MRESRGVEVADEFDEEICQRMIVDGEKSTISRLRIRYEDAGRW